MTSPLPTNVRATNWSADPDKGAEEHREWHDVGHARGNSRLAKYQASFNEVPRISEVSRVYGIPGKALRFLTDTRTIANGFLFVVPFVVEADTVVDAYECFLNTEAQPAAPCSSASTRPSRSTTTPPRAWSPARPPTRGRTKPQPDRRS